jgi:hypothetical protein
MTLQQLLDAAMQHQLIAVRDKQRRWLSLAQIDNDEALGSLQPGRFAMRLSSYQIRTPLPFTALRHHRSMHEAEA